MVSPGSSSPCSARRVAAVLAFLLALAGARGQGSEIAGTMPEDLFPGLREILATAMQRSPLTIEAEFNRARQEAGVVVANAPRLPGVGGQLNYAKNETSISSTNSSRSTADGFFYNLSVNQALFHWGALKNAHDAARLRLAIEERRFDIVHRTVANVLRKAYLALVVEKTRVRHARDTLAQHRTDLRVLETRQQTGGVASAVLEGERLRERELALESDRAEADFAANRARFARLAGLPGLAEDTVPAELPAPLCTPALADAITAALLRDRARGTLEHEIHELAVREAILRHKVARVGLLPKFSLGAGLSLENSTDVNGNTVNQQGIQRQSVSLNAHWSIFDGFATKGATREALAGRRFAERTLAARTEEILQDAQTLARAVGLDARQAELSDIRHGLAIEGRKRLADEARLGNAPQGDADRARLEIIRAEAAKFAARAALLGRWCDLVALAADDPLLKTSRHASEKK